MKHAKKILVWLLAAAMMVCLFACGGEDESNAESSAESKAESSIESSIESSTEEVKIDGKYMLYSMEAEGEAIDYATLKIIGMESSYIELNGEKFVLSFANEEADEGTHDATNKKLVGPDGSAIEYVLDGEKLTIAFEGTEMVFVKEGNVLLTESADTSSADESNENSEETSDVSGDIADNDIYGYYSLVGEGYSAGNYSEPYTPGYVIINEGGTGVFSSNETEMDLAWALEGETFTGTVTMFGEMPMNGTLKDGVLEVIYGDGFYMLFEKGEAPEAAPDGSDNGAVAPDDGEDTLDAYLGDWHGMVVFDECTGDYEGNNEITSEMIARITVDENGIIVPFLAVALGEDNDKNFKNVGMAHYTEDGFDFMMMQGEFYGMPLSYDCYLESDGEVITMYIKSEDEEGNALAFYACLRHLDDEWDKENDYLYMEDDMYDFYYGKTFEEIAALYGFEEGDIPQA